MTPRIAAPSFNFSMPQRKCQPINDPPSFLRQIWWPRQFGAPWRTRQSAISFAAPWGDINLICKVPSSAEFSSIHTIVFGGSGETTRQQIGESEPLFFFSTTDGTPAPHARKAQSNSER